MLFSRLAYPENTAKISCLLYFDMRLEERFYPIIAPPSIPGAGISTEGGRPALVS